MEDILVIILLVVMVTAGMVLFFGGLAGLAFNAYRSMRRSQSQRIRPDDTTSVEAEAFVISSESGFTEILFGDLQDWADW